MDVATAYKLDDVRSDGGDEHLSPAQLDYFRAKLLAWRAEVLAEAELTLAQLGTDRLTHPDQADRASSETDWSLKLRARDRQRKLLSKIEAALKRIDAGEYGYCIVTGEPIALERLEARPVATMTLEAQEKHERRERLSRDE